MDYINYQTQDGDRWDLIAFKNYGDAFAYEGILRANPEVSPDAELVGGITLKIPILEEVTVTADWAPWKS